MNQESPITPNPSSLPNGKLLDHKDDFDINYSGSKKENKDQSEQYENKPKKAPVNSNLSFTPFKPSSYIPPKTGLSSVFGNAGSAVKGFFEGIGQKAKDVGNFIMNRPLENDTFYNKASNNSNTFYNHGYGNNYIPPYSSVNPYQNGQGQNGKYNTPQQRQEELTPEEKADKEKSRNKAIAAAALAFGLLYFGAKLAVFLPALAPIVFILAAFLSVYAAVQAYKGFSDTPKKPEIGPPTLEQYKKQQLEQFMWSIKQQYQDLYNSLNNNKINPVSVENQNGYGKYLQKEKESGYGGILGTKKKRKKTAPYELQDGELPQLFKETNEIGINTDRTQELTQKLNEQAKRIDGIINEQERINKPEEEKKVEIPENLKENEALKEKLNELDTEENNIKEENAKLIEKLQELKGDKTIEENPIKEEDIKLNIEGEGGNSVENKKENSPITSIKDDLKILDGNPKNETKVDKALEEREEYIKEIEEKLNKNNDRLLGIQEEKTKKINEAIEQEKVVAEVARKEEEIKMDRIKKLEERLKKQKSDLGERNNENVRKIEELNTIINNNNALIDKIKESDKKEEKKAEEPEKLDIGKDVKESGFQEINSLIDKAEEKYKEGRNNIEEIKANIETIDKNIKENTEKLSKEVENVNSKNKEVANKLKNENEIINPEITQVAADLNKLENDNINNEEIGKIEEDTNKRDKIIEGFKKEANKIVENDNIAESQKEIDGLKEKRNETQKKLNNKNTEVNEFKTKSEEEIETAYTERIKKNKEELTGLAEQFKEAKENHAEQLNDIKNEIENTSMEIKKFRENLVNIEKIANEDKEKTTEDLLNDEKFLKENGLSKEELVEFKKQQDEQQSVEKVKTPEQEELEKNNIEIEKLKAEIKDDIGELIDYQNKLQNAAKNLNNSTEGVEKVVIEELTVEENIKENSKTEKGFDDSKTVIENGIKKLKQEVKTPEKPKFGGENGGEKEISIEEKIKNLEKLTNKNKELTEKINREKENDLVEKIKKFKEDRDPMVKALKESGFLELEQKIKEFNKKAQELNKKSDDLNFFLNKEGELIDSNIKKIEDPKTKKEKPLTIDDMLTALNERQLLPESGPFTVEKNGKVKANRGNNKQSTKTDFVNMSKAVGFAYKSDRGSETFAELSAEHQSKINKSNIERGELNKEFEDFKQNNQILKEYLDKIKIESLLDVKLSKKAKEKLKTYEEDETKSTISAASTNASQNGKKKNKDLEYFEIKNEDKSKSIKVQIDKDDICIIVAYNGFENKKNISGGNSKSVDELESVREILENLKINKTLSFKSIAPGVNPSKGISPYDSKKLSYEPIIVSFESLLGAREEMNKNNNENKQKLLENKQKLLNKTKAVSNKINRQEMLGS